MDAGILLLLLLPALMGGTQTSMYITARDYLAVTSENYPDSYPGPDTWTWQWSVGSGLWAVLFVDFQLACGQHDRLVISDPRRNLTFSCGNRPSKDYAYLMESPAFSMQLHSTAPLTDQQPRRFKCQVLYATTRGELQSKIDSRKTLGENNISNTKDDSGLLSTHIIVVVLLLLIVPLVVVIVIVVVVILLRRRQLQQSTNTSVHFNIGAIRRDSSVSYTRHGNGPPAGARSRLDSEGSLSQDLPRPKRSPKRSESNASWAMRAEMNTTFRNGSCNSEGEHSATTSPNLYSPCPGEAGPFPEDAYSWEVGHKGLKAAYKGSPTSGVCRLSTICEESSGGSKLRASFPVPVQNPQPSLAIANAGYMLMTSCSANYSNCGQD